MTNNLENSRRNFLKTVAVGAASLSATKLAVADKVIPSATPKSKVVIARDPDIYGGGSTLDALPSSEVAGQRDGVFLRHPRSGLRLEESRSSRRGRRTQGQHHRGPRTLHAPRAGRGYLRTAETGRHQAERYRCMGSYQSRVGPRGLPPFQRSQPRAHSWH